MSLYRRIAAAAVLFAVAGAAHAGEVDPKAQAVIARSKAARQTYALYEWGRVVAPNGEVRETWSAEFNRGRLHRVEVPIVRLIADCDGESGTYYQVNDGKTVQSPDVAKTACGISTTAPFVDGKWLSEVDTPFGKADRIELTDDELVRTYDVTRSGVIVATVFHARTTGMPEVLRSRAVAVLPQLPAEDMFDEASLAKSYVPDAYKTAPKP